MITVDAYRRLNTALVDLRAAVTEVIEAAAYGEIAEPAAHRLLDEAATRIGTRATAVRVGSLSRRGAFAEGRIVAR